MSLGTRLRKLERTKTERHHFHVWGSPELRKATIDGLISSGKATPDDLFICTGVPRWHHEESNYEQSR